MGLFEEHNRWSLKNHILSGICFTQWIKLLWRYRKSVEWFRYGHRIIFLTIFSIFNSIISLPDTIFYHKKIKKQKINTRPIFILGHPRTGTTHLFNLLSLNKQKFIFANTFQVGFPNAFLCTERYGSKILSPIIDKTRPMDNMALSFTVPQEDELATNILSSGTSPYLYLVFPKAYSCIKNFFTFDNIPRHYFEEWTDSFTYFLKKLCLKSELEGGEPKRLLVKSPVHTGRVKLLLSLFPDAQFIYIHRNPYEVCQSAIHMAITANTDSYYGYCYLQAPTEESLKEFVFDQYTQLFDNYIKDRKLVAPENLCELSFAQLEDDPIAQIKRIYEQFNIEGVDDLVPIMKEYCKSLSDFKKNDHKHLDPELKEEIYEKWKASFLEFGYNK